MVIIDPIALLDITVLFDEHTRDIHVNSPHCSHALPLFTVIHTFLFARERRRRGKAGEAGHTNHKFELVVWHSQLFHWDTTKANLIKSKSGGQKCEFAVGRDPKWNKLGSDYIKSDWKFNLIAIQTYPQHSWLISNITTGFYQNTFWSLSPGKWVYPILEWVNFALELCWQKRHLQRHYTSPSKISSVPLGCIKEEG